MTTALHRPARPAPRKQMGAQHGALVAADARALLEFYRTMPERTLAGERRAPVRRARSSRGARDGDAGAPRARAAARARRAHAARSRRGGRRCRRGRVAAHARDDGLAAERVVARRARPARAVREADRRARRRRDAGVLDGDRVGRRDRRRRARCSRATSTSPASACGMRRPRSSCARPTAASATGSSRRSGADTPVVTVVNEAGLVIAPHTRWHRGVTFGGAMIVDLVHDDRAHAPRRSPMRSRIAREQPASSSWGIAIGSRAREVRVRARARRPARRGRAPDAGRDYLVCANRYRSPAMQAGAGRAARRRGRCHSERRERRLRALSSNRGRAPRRSTPEDLARFLGDRRVDAPAQRRELGGDPRAGDERPLPRSSRRSRARALVGVDRAPSCEGTWAELAWSWDGRPALGAWHRRPAHGRDRTTRRAARRRRRSTSTRPRARTRARTTSRPRAPRSSGGRRRARRSVAAARRPRGSRSRTGPSAGRAQRCARRDRARPRGLAARDR